MFKEAKVVFLAAGKGSRLGSLFVPKAMIEVAGKPIISRGFAAVIGCRIGKNDSTVVVGHLKQKLIDYCQSDFLTVTQEVPIKEMPMPWRSD